MSNLFDSGLVKTAVRTDLNVGMEALEHPMRVGIANPLPHALAHFESALTHSFGSIAGIAVSAVSIPSIEMRTGASLLDKLRQAIRYVRGVRKLKREAHVDLIINVWPALGYLESLVWSRSPVAVLTILHEVDPLRSQFGYWKRVVPILQRVSGSTHQWVVHGERAAKDASEAGFGDLVVVPHPVMAGMNAAVQRPTSGETAVVFGQWKPARDLELLARLGPPIEELGLRPVITGRDWPAVDGWDVDNRFVDEDEIAPLLRDAACVLLPYAHYYQSGVALRALEVGTPVVGARTAFLEEFFGPDWPGFVADPDDPIEWVEAIARVRLLDSAVLETQVNSAQQIGTQRWGAVLLAHKAHSATYLLEE